jgi:uncharacterized protein DUF3352
VPIATRRVLALVLTALAVVFVAACGSSGSSGPSNPAAADPAAIAPAGSPIYVEVNVKPSASQGAAVDALSKTIFNVPNPSAKLIQLIDKAGLKDNVNYDSDIKPWLGDKLALVLTSIGASANATNFAGIIDTTDPSKALAAIKKGSPNLKSGSVDGVDYLIAADGKTWAGTISDYLVVGTPAGFTAVAAAQKGAKLTSQASFQAARAKAPADRLAYLYVDTNSILNAVGRQSATVESQIGSLKSFVGGINAISASLVASPTSIEVDATTVGTDKAFSAPAAKGPSTLPLAQAPGDAWLAVSLRNIGPRLTSLLAALNTVSSTSGGPTIAQALAQLQQATGLNVQRDLFSWMGDAGAFVSGSSLSNLGAAIVIHSTDPAASKRAVAKIGQLLAALGRNPKTIAVAGGGTGIQVAVTATTPPVQIAATGSLFIIALGKGTLQDTLHPTSQLGTSPNFQQAVASLKGATPALYLNLQTAVSYLQPLLASQPSAQKVMPYLSAFQSLIAGSNSGTAKIVLNVK